MLPAGMQVAHCGLLESSWGLCRTCRHATGLPPHVGRPTTVHCAQVIEDPLGALGSGAGTVTCSIRADKGSLIVGRGGSTLKQLSEKCELLCGGPAQVLSLPWLC